MIDYHMSSQDYHARPEVGSSGAKLVLDSIQLYKDEVDGFIEHKQSAAMQFGTLAHLAILEPAKFESRTTCVGPINPKTLQAYGRETKAFTEWQEANPDVIVIDKSLMMMISRMPPAIAEMLSMGNSEVSVFADVCGVPAKCRPDKLFNGQIYDLKTIDDLDNIDNNIRNFRYWYSAAHYRAVMLAETENIHSFELIFAEKKPPYRWAVVELSPEYIEIGDYYVGHVMGEIKRAMRTGNWADRSPIRRIATKPELLGAFDHDHQ